MDIALIVIASIVSLGLTSVTVVMVLHMRSKLLEATRISIYEEGKTKNQENSSATKISSIVTGTLPRECYTFRKILLFHIWVKSMCAWPRFRPRNFTSMTILKHSSSVDYSRRIKTVSGNAISLFLQGYCIRFLAHGGVTHAVTSMVEKIKFYKKAIL